MTTQSNPCAINPEIGYEHEVLHGRVAPLHSQKNVLVVGGGVGGLQAAVTAAERGHKVTLCEAADELGGSLRCEKNVPFKKHLQEYLDAQGRIAEKAGVDIRLNTFVTPEMAQEMAPDAIIVAVGAQSCTPNIPGIESENVIHAEDAYQNPEAVGQCVVVLGGGLTGIESAIFFASQGKDVSIVQRPVELKYGGNVIHAMAANWELRRMGVKVYLNTTADEITPEGVLVTYHGDETAPVELCGTLKASIRPQNVEAPEGLQAGPQGEAVLLEADTIINALGMVPLRDEASVFTMCAPEVYALGDCVNVGNIRAATSAAYGIANDLGSL